MQSLSVLPQNYLRHGRGLVQQNGDAPFLGTVIAEMHTAIVELQDSNLRVRGATTANLNLATTGLTVIDGVTPVAGDLWLVKDQSTGSQNGIYVVGATAWARAKDADGNPRVGKDQLVEVALGTANAGTQWFLGVDPNVAFVVDTTTLTYTANIATSAAASNATPAALGANIAPAAGASATFSRSDHKHGVRQAPQIIVAAGAFTPSQAVEVTLIDLATAANNVTATLADGTIDGQVKEFLNTTASAAKTTQVTVTHHVPGTTGVVTMTAAGDGFRAVWSVSLTKWVVMQLFGTASLA